MPQRLLAPVATLLLGLVIGFIAPKTLHSLTHQRAEREIFAFIDEYFTTWSAADIDAYGKLFEEAAVIQLIREDGVVNQTKIPFLEGQRQSHRNSPHPLAEWATSVHIAHHGATARVEVRWRLESQGRAPETGWDHFTLRRHPDGWKIVNLIFYSDSLPVTR
jgi:ketosteroid isomerase-like protein